MLSVAAYTGGANTPSARFRVRQYVSSLGRLGIELREFRARFGSYPPALKALRPLWGAATLGDRLLSAPASFFADVTLLQREMISTLLTAEPLTRKPRVLDVDDAIWLRSRGGAAKRLAKLCAAVICGNDFLAENFRQWNPNVHTLATAVDTTRYCPVEQPMDASVKRIGWSGESSNFPHLQSIAPALRVLLARHRNLVFRVISDRWPRLEGIAEDRTEFVQWSPETEVRTIQEMSVGIMPLLDTAWSRGKCSFKLLTYMACGIPVVASPVGMNAAVLAAGGGYGPSQVGDWVDAIDYLLTNEKAGRQMSRQGRQAVVDNYSLTALSPKLAAILKSCKDYR